LEGCVVLHFSTPFPIFRDEAIVARMERSEIRGGIDASRQSRITLRSIRATALHPLLQGEGRPPQAGGVGCSAPPLARAPVDAVTPPAALRASTSPSRGGGEISSLPSSDNNTRCGNESFRVNFVSCRSLTGGAANSIVRTQETPGFPTLTGEPQRNFIAA
jgi:hypothetical protein